MVYNQGRRYRRINDKGPPGNRAIREVLALVPVALNHDQVTRTTRTPELASSSSNFHTTQGRTLSLDRFNVDRTLCSRWFFSGTRVRTYDMTPTNPLP
ncbi:hypothetical protein TNCV_2394781 [Trichonephila clavipes]|nr:hypothetical protein TNCV_2394781 [Trichonephila clavipes]